MQRRADAGHDVLALGVGQVLAEEHLLARVGVAREGDARARVVAHVAEDHGHDVDRGAQVVADLVVLAVVVRALAEPRCEDGLDGQVELLVRVGRKVPAGLRLDHCQELGHQLAQGRSVKIGVLLDAAARLGRFQGVLELLAVDAHHDPAEHLDEAPVGVPAEALVAGQRDEAMEGLLVQAQVEDRVHHAGHRELGTRADADQQRIGGVAEALAGLALDFADCRQDVVPQPVGQLLARGEVVVARLGGDGEARRHRQAGVGHLGQPGALAAEQVAHRRVALRAAAAEGVDVALGRAVLARGRQGATSESSETSGAQGTRRAGGFVVLSADCTRGSRIVRLALSRRRAGRPLSGCPSIASRSRTRWQPLLPLPQ